MLSIFVYSRKFSRNIASYMVEPFSYLGRHRYSLFKLSVPLMAVLELNLNSPIFMKGRISGIHSMMKGVGSF